MSKNMKWMLWCLGIATAYILIKGAMGFWLNEYPGTACVFLIFGVLNVLCLIKFRPWRKHEGS